MWASVNQSSRSLVVYTEVKAMMDVANGLGEKIRGGREGGGSPEQRRCQKKC